MLAFIYVFGICVVAAILFVAVNEIEPDRRATGRTSPATATAPPQRRSTAGIGTSAAIRKPFGVAWACASPSHSDFRSVGSAIA
jgi:hypothetical protein